MEVARPADVFRLWRPLAGTLLLMAVEFPLITAFIARQEHPEMNLAAFGIVVGLGIVLEAPVLRFLSVSIAMVVDRQSYLYFHKFVLLHVSITTVAGLLAAIDPLYSLVTRDVMGLSPELRALVQPSLLLWVTFPALVGYRRVYQGILIRAQRAHKVTHGTIIRLITIPICLVLLTKFTNLNGVLAGVTSSALGLVAELIASRLFAANEVRSILAMPSDIAQAPLQYGKLARFYYPLALSSAVLLISQPIESLFVAQSRLALQSLALIPVLHGLLNPFTWSGYAIQDTALTFLNRSSDSLPAVRRFAALLASVLSGTLALITLTPLAEVWYQHINGISPALMELIRLPTVIVVLVPAMTVWKSFQRGYMVSRHKTFAVLMTEILEVTLFTVLIIIFVRAFDMVGILAASLSGLISGLAGIAILAGYIHLAAREKKIPAMHEQ